MIGWDKTKRFRRVLKIDRTERCDLHILEDSTIYSETECTHLLTRIHLGNKSTGGLKFVTLCYGIVGNVVVFFFSMLLIIYIIFINKRKFCQLFYTRLLVYIVSTFCYFRLYKVFGTSLHAPYYTEEEDWCYMWSSDLCYCQDQDDSSPEFDRAIPYDLF